MKSRELMTCETKVFAAKIKALKPKEVQRHIRWASSYLGVQDSDALTRTVLEAVFKDGDLPHDSGEEMRRVLNAVSPWVADAQEQSDPLLRLVALYVTYVRKGVQDLVLAQRRQARQAPHPVANPADGHEGHPQCLDPDCRDHGHTHHRGATVAQNPLARGIRTVIG